MNRINRRVQSLALAALACAALVVTSRGILSDDSAASTNPNIPEEKHTTLGLYVTAAEAYDAWRTDPDGVKVLDVRTPEEYLYVGHAMMAVNIPLLIQTYEWDAGGRQLVMKPNADFLPEVEKWAQPEDRILVMCRSGGRSARAVNKLAEAGFTNAYSIVDGMEGDVVADPDSPDYGKRELNGWKNAGLPWTYALNPESMHLPAGR